MSFSYYIPGATKSPSLAELPELKLEHAFDRKPVDLATSGPEGGGVVFARSAGGGYYPDRQTWRKIPGSPAWVGLFTDSPLLPEEVARPRQLDGHLVTLADDQQWLIPVARAFAEEEGELRWYVNLPTISELDDAGHWIKGSVSAKFARLWEFAESWQASKNGANEDDTFEFDGLHEAALEALATNYYIGPAEAALANLLNQAMCVDILNALVDYPTLSAWVASREAKAVS